QPLRAKGGDEEQIGRHQQDADPDNTHQDRHGTRAGPERWSRFHDRDLPGQGQADPERGGGRESGPNGQSNRPAVSRAKTEVAVGKVWDTKAGRAKKFRPTSPERERGAGRAKRVESAVPAPGH